MAESSLAILASPQLFRLCAAHPDSDEYWLEFVRRFNPLLARSIAAAWRRKRQGEWPPAEVAADLLQDVYAIIVKNDSRLLRDFRGDTEAEAEAYLAHTAINRTISFLRTAAEQSASKTVSWEELLEEHGEIEPTAPSRPPRKKSPPPRKKLTERELIQVLKHCLDGPNGERDVLIFLLYAYDGYSVAEIAGMGVWNLKATSISNLLGLIKARLRECLGREE